MATLNATQSVETGGVGLSGLDDDDRPRAAPAARRRLLAASGFTAALLLWQLIGSFLDPIYISTPARVAGALYDILTGPNNVWPDIKQSVGELYLGLFLALTLGLVLGVALGQSRRFSAAVTPYLTFLNATPIVITLPLLTVWVGITFKARIIFITLLAVWPVLLNVAAGCRNVSGRYIELGDSLGLSRRQKLCKVVLPGVVPYFLSGARVACGLSVVGMVVAEMEVSVTGIGYLLATFGSGFQTDKLLAVFVLVSLFGVINVAVLLALARRFAPWTGIGRR